MDDAGAGTLAIGRGGTGLGMSIVENLVTKTLGGQLSLQSVVGRGTTLTVTLPRHAPLQDSA